MHRHGAADTAVMRWGTQQRRRRIYQGMQTGQHGCTERCKGVWQGCSIGAAAGAAEESRGLQQGMCCGEPRGCAQAAPGRGRQRQPCAHLWALPASRCPTRGCPAHPAAWRPGWTRRGCSPLPRPCGRRPTGCLRTREMGWHGGGAAHIGEGPAPQRCPCSCAMPTRPGAVKCTSPRTCHRVIPSCGGGAEAPTGAATTMPLSGHPR